MGDTCMSGSERPATSIEVIDSQTDLYPGDWDLVIRHGDGVAYITIGASEDEIAAALESAKAGGKYVQEGGEQHG